MKGKQQYASHLQVGKRSLKELATDQMYFNGQ